MIRVIGIGSPFGDDQAGWLVIRRLQDGVPSTVNLLTLDQPGATLINWISGVDHLILVDALLCPQCREPFREVGVDEVDQGDRMLSSHGLNLSQTLQLAASLGYLPHRIEIYGVVVTEPKRESLSDTTAAHADALAAHLRKELSNDRNVCVTSK